MNIESSAAHQTNGQPPTEAPWAQHAAEAEQRLEAQAVELRVMLHGERELATRMQADLDEIKDREKRIERALAMLAGEKLGPGRPPKSTPAKSTQDKQGWQPSERKVEQVRVALEALGEGRSSQIADRAGVSYETVRKAITVLREREEVRVVSQSKANGPTFAPMPGVTDAA